MQRIVICPWAGEVTGADTVEQAEPIINAIIGTGECAAEIVELAHGPCLKLDRPDGTRLASVFGPREALTALLG